MKCFDNTIRTFNTVVLEIHLQTRDELLLFNRLVCDPALISRTLHEAGITCCKADSKTVEQMLTRISEHLQKHVKVC